MSANGVVVSGRFPCACRSRPTYGSRGMRLMARPAARRAVNSSAAGLQEMHEAGTVGWHPGDDLVDAGEALTDQLEAFLATVLVVRRRLQRFVAVHRRERHVGVGREPAPRVERLEFALGLAQPAQAAQIVLGHPRLEPLRLAFDDPRSAPSGTGCRRWRPSAASRRTRATRGRTAGTVPTAGRTDPSAR